MKLLSSMLMLFLFSVCASAQTLSDQSAGSHLIVLQKKWRLEVRNAALEKDPVADMKEREAAETERKNTERNNDTLREKGMPTSSSGVPGPNPGKGGRGISATYVYEMTVRNTGKKSIRGLTWEYVFYESGNEIEVGRRRFVSRISIGSGKTKTVMMRSALPPTGTIDARNANGKSKDPYSEQVVIQSVEFADGTAWRSPSN
jgi:hypothetical protein